jgi:subtilase family serine protease
MGDQSGTGAGKDERGAGATGNLEQLQTWMDQLSQVEQRLIPQWHELQGRIDQYTKEAQQAWQRNRNDLAEQALQQRAQLMPALAAVQEQLGRIRTRKEEITRQRQELLDQASGKGTYLPSATGAGGSGAPSALPAQKPSRKRRRWFGLLSALLALLVLTTLGLNYVLHQGAPTGSKTTGVHPHPTHAPTATPYPQPTPQAHPFQPDGSGPTTQDCLRAIGHPCYSPEQIQHAFGLDALYKPGYDGTGQTIVLLGAGVSSTIKSDLQHFDTTWGLPDPPSFQILQPHGPPAPYTCPDGQDDLASENALDVEWAHAIAPGANIVLLIWFNSGDNTSPADNCGIYSLEDGVAYAVDNHLGQIISISYGGSELGSVSETPDQHGSDQKEYQGAHAIFENAIAQGITILAAAGDQGVTNSDGGAQPDSVWSMPNVQWPASDPDVLAVGGTLLHLQDDGSYGSEEVWNERDFGASGGGLSSVFQEPDYQQTQPDQPLFSGKRSIPDVSFPADNFPVYGGFTLGDLGQANAKWAHWDVLGGTSASSPCWAGLIAILDQMRNAPVGLLQPALYSLHGKGMHDITSGNNSFGGVQGYSALGGYDLASGWGTPIANRLLPDLIAALNGGSNLCSGGQHQCT